MLSVVLDDAGGDHVTFGTLLLPEGLEDAAVLVVVSVVVEDHPGVLVAEPGGHVIALAIQDFP